MHTITKSFEFAASHQLRGLVDGHKCSRLHGHSYEAGLELTGETDEVGFVIDFGELKHLTDLIRDRLDHRHLNDVLEVNPTSENLASWIAEATGAWLDGRSERARLTELVVRVSESRSTSASVRIPLR